MSAYRDFSDQELADLLKTHVETVENWRLGTLKRAIIWPGLLLFIPAFFSVWHSGPSGLNLPFVAWGFAAGFIWHSDDKRKTWLKQEIRTIEAELEKR